MRHLLRINTNIFLQNRLEKCSTKKFWFQIYTHLQRYYVFLLFVLYDIQRYVCMYFYIHMYIHIHCIGENFIMSWKFFLEIRKKAFRSAETPKKNMKKLKFLPAKVAEKKSRRKVKSAQLILVRIVSAFFWDSKTSHTKRICLVSQLISVYNLIFEIMYL